MNESATALLVVTAAATKLTVSPPSSRLLRVGFTAVLIRMHDGAPLAGQAVRFTVSGTTTCTAVTNGSGVATCTKHGPIIRLGTATVTATYAGDTDHAGTTGHVRAPSIAGLITILGLL